MQYTFPFLSPVLIFIRQVLQGIFLPTNITTAQGSPPPPSSSSPSLPPFPKSVDGKEERILDPKVRFVAAQVI